MLSRRDFMQVAAASAAMLPAAASLGHAASGQKLTQEELLKFETKRQADSPELHRYPCANCACVFPRTLG